ncbi:MAG: heme exporter protein CcmB [SAR324 cluster bacterium]|nr:heme exporter protein CcmB [SAR324 cluster bacterium]
MIPSTVTLLAKDLKLDLRSLENFISMLFFGVIILLIFAFALPIEDDSHEKLAPGLYWVVFLLSGILNLNKLFQIEKENGCMDAVLLAPIPRGSIFLGKMLENIIFITAMQVIMIPLFSLFFFEGLMVHFFELLGLSVFTAIGFSSLGTLLGGLTTDVRFKEILLPILLFPLLVPLLLASVILLQSLVGGNGLFAEADWLKLLIGFDLIYLVVSYLVFDIVMEI